MPRHPRILLVGTVDTKSAEISFLREQVLEAGGEPLVMDVGVLGSDALVPDVANHEVAAAAGRTLQQLMSSGDECSAMNDMARGASTLAARFAAEGRIHGALVLGGTMGTDLALDVASALPLGMPKVVLSTVSFSPLIPPERLAPDLTMVLWSGGLYGLNGICRSTLAQAAGAAVGAARTARPPRFDRPVVGMTSLGSSVLKYMVRLTPELEARGYEVAVFHTTGMGGRAFEALAAQGRFACVMDFSLQELVNERAGSVVSSGPDRLRGAGRAGVPQIVAPGATDMVDYPAWSQPPSRFAGRPTHAHNRLIASVSVDPVMRREVATDMLARLSGSRGAVHLLLPLQGIEQWDRADKPMYDPKGLSAFMEAALSAAAGAVRVEAIDCHINDEAFIRRVLEIFDRWVSEGLIRKGRPPREATHETQCHAWESQ